MYLQGKLDIKNGNIIPEQKTSHLSERYTPGCMEWDVWNRIGCYDSIRDLPEDIDPNSSLLLETVGPIQARLHIH